MPANTPNLPPGGGPNAPGGLDGTTAFGYLSSSTSGRAVQPTLGVGSDLSLGFYSSAGSHVALSYGTLTLPSGFSIGGNMQAGSGAAGSPSYAFSSEISLGFYRSAASAVALSRGTLDLFTNANALSMATVANTSGMTIGQLRIVFAASGISLIYSSGATQYTIGGSSTSLAQV